MSAAELAVCRVHGAAMEPSFRDGEFLEVNFGPESHHGCGGVAGVGAEIVVSWKDGRHELIKHFGDPVHEGISRFGYVVRRLDVVSSRAKVIPIDARRDARWRERRRPTRLVYAQRY